MRYVKPIKRQLIGPDRALCVERHESSGPPDAGFVVDVRVRTPEVRQPPALPAFRPLSAGVFPVPPVWLTAAELGRPGRQKVPCTATYCKRRRRDATGRRLGSCGFWEMCCCRSLPQRVARAERQHPASQSALRMTRCGREDRGACRRARRCPTARTSTATCSGRPRRRGRRAPGCASPARWEPMGFCRSPSGPC